MLMEKIGVILACDKEEDPSDPNLRALARSKCRRAFNGSVSDIGGKCPLCGGKLILLSFLIKGGDVK